MDFQLSPEQDAFRARVRGWLADNVPGWAHAASTAHDADDDFDRHRDWHRCLHAAGYVGLTWPQEYGGGGRSAFDNAILQEELVRARAPAIVNALGLGLCGPAILHHGRPDQRERFLAPMLRADEIWCQGYSEPGAGSDLAGLATKAERRGDRYVVNGQKIWTSQAHHADWCFALVRTDPSATKHDGIGFLLIDMQTPGIEFRPIRMITGSSEFNEVFFTDVEVPVANLVGEEGQGWRIANTVLGYERGANTLSMYAGYQRELPRLAALAQQLSEPRATVMRQRLAQLAIDVEILRLSSLRQLTHLARDEPPGPEASVQKLYWSELDQRFFRLAVDLQGGYGQIGAGSDYSVDGGRWQLGEINSRRFSIARGTSEIQRNIISERVLGLPRR